MIEGFVYEQATGRFLYRSGNSVAVVGLGYAGAPAGLNDPLSDHLRSVGPLPKGGYVIRERIHPRFASPAFALTPQAGNRMHGRSGFWVHGDNAKRDQSASSGCIILGRDARLAIRNRLAHGAKPTLIVVEGVARRA